MSGKVRYTISHKTSVKNIILAGEKLVEQFYEPIYNRVYVEHTRIRGIFFKKPCSFRTWSEKQDIPWNYTVFEFALKENLIDEFEYRITETYILLREVKSAITKAIDAPWVGEMMVDSTIADALRYIEETAKMAKLMN